MNDLLNNLTAEQVIEFLSLSLEEQLEVERRFEELTR
jgi:hypothetical protein